MRARVEEVPHVEGSAAMDEAIALAWANTLRQLELPAARP